MFIKSHSNKNRVRLPLKGVENVYTRFPKWWTKKCDDDYLQKNTRKTQQVLCVRELADLRYSFCWFNVQHFFSSSSTSSPFHPIRSSLATHQFLLQGVPRHIIAWQTKTLWPPPRYCCCCCRRYAHMPTFLMIWNVNNRTKCHSTIYCGAWVWVLHSDSRILLKFIDFY